MAKFKQLRTPSHGEIQTARNSKPWRNSNSSELQAMAKFKQLGTPSHGENQIAWNSKPWKNSNSMKQNCKVRAYKGHQCFDLHFWSGSRQIFDKLPTRQRTAGIMQPRNFALSFLMCELRQLRIRCSMSTALETNWLK